MAESHVERRAFVAGRDLADSRSRGMAPSRAAKVAASAADYLTTIEV